jgi:hypothetical protein
MGPFVMATSVSLTILRPDELSAWPKGPVKKGRLPQLGGGGGSGRGGGGLGGGGRGLGGRGGAASPALGTKMKPSDATYVRAHEPLM